ncbi:hypothetical protein K1719_038840 [Acacia pycnantha]|nr:hypothetical protein K1719_038840 [Acacia pycnantha]
MKGDKYINEDVALRLPQRSIHLSRRLGLGSRITLMLFEGRRGERREECSGLVSKLEHLQAAFGGFSVPEEVPFFPQELPEEWRSATDPAAMPEPENPLVLDPVATAPNFISKLWSLYVLGILAHMNLKQHNDGRQGSALTCDASCIQAISKRVHWGKFLAEAKFQSRPDEFKQAVEAQSLEKLNSCLMCQEHRDGAVKRYVQMANATADKQVALAANVYIGLVLPFTEVRERDYIVAKLSGLP